MNGWRTHILEHNIELGGVCTAWRRGDYLIDGCIHWLMGGGEGGMFRPIYDELGITSEVELKTIEMLHRYEDVERGSVVELTRNIDHYRDALLQLSPEDGEEIERLIEAVDRVRDLPSSDEVALEPASLLERIDRLWNARHVAGTLVHYRGTISEWCERTIRGAALRDYLGAMLAPDMPVIFLPVLVQQLVDGQMSRPVGGSGRFRDALENRYRALGGSATLHTTVEEILVENDRAIGVRLTDGTELRAEGIVSTASAHETLLRLLGGRYIDRATRHRLDEWPTFEPIVLLSVGVALPLEDLPSTLLIKETDPIAVGKRASHMLLMRIYNDDPSFAPAGHCVVQTMLPTRYDWWATRGAAYATEKRRVEHAVLRRFDERVPGLAAAVRITDLATPLTFWAQTRSWRGAYEGWLPTPETFYAHVPKSVPGLTGLHLAGQWVEPGGGVPMALASGRRVVQLLCEEAGREFRNVPTA
jgi:phytoene desaturase